MAITISSAACTAACDTIVDLCDAGGTGFVRFQNAGGTTRVQIAFSAAVSAFGGAVVSAGSGNASCAVPISATFNTASDTISIFQICNAASAVIWSGTCTTGAGDFVFSNLNGVTGDTIVITALNFIVGPT